MLYDVLNKSHNQIVFIISCGKHPEVHLVGTRL